MFANADSCLSGSGSRDHDGHTTLFTYGATNARLTSVTFSRGTLSYGYDSAGRVSTLTDPGRVGLVFSYDGALPLTETWSGPVEGVVSRTFINHFELATESVNGAATESFREYRRAGCVSQATLVDS